MIRKLRLQFIAAAAAAVLIVLGSAILIINGTMRGLVYFETNQVLDTLSAWGDDDWDAATRRPVAGTMLGNRFFRLVLSDSGEITDVDMGRNVALAQSDLDELAASLDLSKSRGRILFVEEGTVTVLSFRIQRTEGEQGTSVVFLDMTATVNMERQLLRTSLVMGLLSFAAFLFILSVLSRWAIRPAIQNMENQKRFITNAGHELKTPLAIISANTELLEAMNGESEWTRNIQSQVKRLSGLVAELITLSRVSEQEKVALTAVDLAPLAREGAESFRPLALQRGLTLEASIPEQAMVQGETRFLQELVNILLDNAVKYCDDGGTILLSLSSAGDRRTALEVSNDYAAGQGVNFSRFFERFYQEEQSHNKGKSGGFGIGLSMAQELVRIMEGRIQTEYREGRITFRAALKNAAKSS